VSSADRIAKRRLGAKRARTERLNAAIDRLAGLFEFGHLMAETTPADLLNAASDEIERLRAVAAAEKEG
jgi:hypothetical protein